MRTKSYIVVLVSMLFFFISCKKEDLYLPKPRLYPKIDFPIKQYQDLEEKYCDFSFRYPTYATINQDKYFFEDQPQHPCWFDIHTPELNAKLHCSYYPISNRKQFDKLVNDAFTLAGKHNIKADYYNETLLNYPGDVNGIMFEIEGDVATPVQFFLTDSTRHFFRGSLYFNNKVNPDSMAPVYKFVKQDIDSLIYSMEWK